MKMIKNFIANIPVMISIPFQLLLKIFTKICSFFIVTSAAIHIILKTETGIKLQELEGKMKEAEVLAKKLGKKASGSIGKSSTTGNPKLKNIITKGVKSGSKDPTWH